ncbi:MULTISPECIES: DMT family transporter [unclassified Tateyamaria]|uniref:DMT family transporter n=1 Tax=unclassified Tateyamaria TaxID=2645127 RepID=UPI000D54B1FF|nr:DMT family transporter [Tateyamaria sp. Alg231-49]
MYTAKPHNPALAAILIAVACAFIAATTLIAKTLASTQFGTPLHPFQVVFGRFLFAFLSFATVAAILRPTLQRPHLGLHVTRTLGGWAGLTLMFASVAHIPLADATAISFLNPVFGMIFAIPLLGERVGKWRWSAALIALVGAVILLRPTPDSFQPGALYALAAAVILGFELNIIKKLTGRENPFSILVVNNAIGVGIASLAVVWVWIWPTPMQWALMAGLGCAMAVAQTCFVNAMARADASFVAPLTYGTLIFAAAYDVLFYDVIPDGVTILGASIIVAGALLLAWREAVRTQPKHGQAPL